MEKRLHRISLWAGILGPIFSLIIFFTAKPYFKDWIHSDDKNQKGASKDTTKKEDAKTESISTFTDTLEKKEDLKKGIFSSNTGNESSLNIPNNPTDKKKETCIECNGNGTLKLQISCGACNGRGKVTCRQCSGTGKWGPIYPTKGSLEPPACSMCLGTGISKCPNCEGKGEVAITKTCSKCNGIGYYFSQ
jgi:RecJ-like exonuclease